jgi:hypothetical protein
MTAEPTKKDLNDAFGTTDEDWGKDEDKWETDDGNSPSWDFKTIGIGAKISGAYIGSHPAKTKFGDRTVYTLEQSNHERIDIWGTAMLVRAFEKTTIGQRVRIEYKGKEQTDKGQQINTFKFQREKL